MRYRSIFIAAGLLSAPSLFAVEKQAPALNQPMIRTAPVQMNEATRMSQQIADLRRQVSLLQQSVSTLQQELAATRADYARHTHRVFGSAAPVADVVRNPGSYPRMRLWVGHELPETGAPNPSR